MTAYLTVAELKVRTLLPSEYVDEVPLAFVEAQLESWSRWMDTRLGKRYASPFAGPTFPEAIKSWLARIVTLRIEIRRGVDPSDAQYKTLEDDAKMAMDEIKEAANSDTGLFDLPLLDSALGSAIALGGPKVYSEQSPYVNYDVQRDIAFNEDSNRRGSN